MIDIVVYRDDPKRGETDAQWCGYVKHPSGHILRDGTTGHPTPGDAAAALGADADEQNSWNASFGFPQTAGKTDWYENRNALRVDQVFRCQDGTLVKLEGRVPGDGTKWIVADWSHGSWGHYDSEIEPGDLDVLVPDPAIKGAS